MSSMKGSEIIRWGKVTLADKLQVLLGCSIPAFLLVKLNCLISFLKVVIQCLTCLGCVCESLIIALPKEGTVCWHSLEAEHVPCPNQSLTEKTSNIVKGKLVKNIIKPRGS